MLRLVRVGNDEAPDLQQYGDRTVFQTREWLDLIARTQDAELVTAEVRDGTSIVGRYSGLVVRKFGVRILGSPFPGWTSAYMGFNLDPCIARGEVLGALEEFAFRELGCIHLEIMDRHLRAEEYERAGYTYTNFTGFEIDLTQTEEKLFAAMEPACRRNMRKAEREGVTVELTNDPSFIDEYYDQLEEVFARQKLVPTYPKERVAMMLRYILPTGRLLLVKAKDRTGRCIATGIFLAMNDMAYFWGGASRRAYQDLRPNDAIQWFAMRHFRSMNIQKYDMGGSGEFKRKFGGYDIAIPWGRKSKYAAVKLLRDWCFSIFKARQQVIGALKEAKFFGRPPGQEGHMREPAPQAMSRSS